MLNHWSRFLHSQGRPVANVKTMVRLTQSLAEFDLPQKQENGCIKCTVQY